jgi:hypothetical protein
MFNFSFHDVAMLCIEKCAYVSAHFQFEYAVEGECAPIHNNPELFKVVMINKNAHMVTLSSIKVISVLTLSK